MPGRAGTGKEATICLTWRDGSAPLLAAAAAPVYASWVTGIAMASATTTVIAAAGFGLCGAACVTDQREMQIGYAADQHPRPHIGYIMLISAERRAKMNKSRTGKGKASVTFTLDPGVGAQTAAVCGEWNDWSAGADVMRRDAEGGFSLTVDLDAGRAYRFRYLLDGERWENDWAADAYLANSFGGDNSVVDLTALAQAAPPVAKKAPAKKAPAKKAPAEKAPAEKAPAEKAPAEKAPAEKAPAEKAPAEKAPAEKAPAKTTGKAAAAATRPARKPKE